MTDLPAAARERARRRCCPPLVTPVTRAGLRRRHHPQDALARRTTAPSPSRCSCATRTGPRSACPARPAAGWPARSAPPARAGCSATCPPRRSSSRCARPRPPPATARSASPTRLSNVVFMGMGEPLANYKRVVAAVRRITEPGPGRPRASPRAASRCRPSGSCPAIDKLAAEGLPVTLAVSLHAPDDELRDTLVPVNNRWKVAEVLDAARRYADADRAPGLDRVRADPRRQRPAVAGRPARHGCCGSGSGPSGCTSTSSRSTRPRAASGTPRRAPVQDEFVRRVRAGGRGVHRARHPRPGDRRRLRPARRHLGLS